MNILFLDCSSGISGDMFLSSLIDAGLDEEYFLSLLNQVDLGGYSLSFKATESYGISGKKLEINASEHHPHRHLKDIEEIINKSILNENIKKKSLQLFYTLAEAEAKVHNSTPEKVHFHEVGAVDSIVDLVGAAIAIDTLNPDRVYCNTLSLGSGFVNCQHGTLPVPAPATAELVKGLPVRYGPAEGEMVTPTGAAIIKCFVDSFTVPDLKIDEIGYGLGSKDFCRPNALRAILGTSEVKTGEEEICVIECNIDDMNPEFSPYLQDLLISSGALDVFIHQIVMKKGRPGLQIQVICHPDKVSSLEEILFRNTTTFGIRKRYEKRRILERKTVTAKTAFGDIRIKLGFLPGNNELLQVSPEFEDCKQAALNHNRPLRVIYQAAIEGYKDYT